MEQNLEMEFRRNRERYQFLKWGMQAFETFKVVPPGIGIVHQVNLEYLAKGVLGCPCALNSQASTLYYPDTLVGTDSHTTMINGLGIVGWGVGGIEAEAGMLGQPVYFLTPDVVGVHLTGALREGVTATDLALDGHADAAQGEGGGQVRRILRAGRGGAAGGGPRDDCQHGAGIRRDDGLLPDRRRVRELPPRHRAAARSIAGLYENYYHAQGLLGIPKKGEIEYSQELELDLGDGRAERGRPEAAAGPDRTAEAEEEFVAALASRSPKMDLARRRRIWRRVLP